MPVRGRPEPSGNYEKRTRAASEVPQVSPDTHDANANDPIGTVGPQAVLGTNVMYPSGGYHADAWAGWPVDWKMPWMNGFGYGIGDPGGYLNRISTASTAIDLNSRTLASFPIYGVEGARRVLLPPWAKNPEPEVYSDFGDFMKAAANSIYATGETVLFATSFYAPDRTGKQYPSRFVALAPDTYRVELEDNRRVVWLNGRPLRRDEYCHIRHQVVAGRASGVAPMEWTARNMVSASALEAYATDIATQGVWAVLKWGGGNLSQKQRIDAQTSWVESRQNALGAPAVLTANWDLETLSLSPKDMALLDLKIFDEQRIAAAYGVPAFLLNLPMADGLTYANANDLFEFHWRSTLREKAQSIASAMSQWLLPGNRAIEFNPDRYTQPPFAERVQGWATMHGIQDESGPAMTVDEIRAAERMSPNREEALAASLTGGST